MSGHTAMSCVKKEMHRQFGDEILLEEEKHAWEHHGWFLLKFQYIPKPYMIQFEGEFNCFNVRITNLSAGSDFSYSGKSVSRRTLSSIALSLSCSSSFS